MNTKTLRLIFAFLMLSAIAMAFGSTALASETTVVGTITEDGGIETPEGEYIEVEDTDEGNEMLENAGKTVEARGTVTETDGMKSIAVSSYSIVE